MIPQGDSSTYAMLPVRELIGTYLGLTDDYLAANKGTAKKEESSNKSNNDDINFASQMKK